MWEQIQVVVQIILAVIATGAIPWAFKVSLKLAKIEAILIPIDDQIKLEKRVSTIETKLKMKISSTAGESS